MSGNSGSGGVRNLRAMFENKATDQSTSPPSRGRSPNPSELSNNSRPVSKVRASFVAVEKTGENGGAPILGLRRMNSEVSSQGEPKGNITMDGRNGDNTLGEVQTLPKTDTASEPKDAPPSADDTGEGGLGKILKGSAFVESASSQDLSGVTETSNAPSLGLQQVKPATSPSRPKDQTEAAGMVQKMEAGKESKPGPPPTTLLQTTKTAQPIKPPPTRQSITKPAPKSPATSKPSPQTQTSPLAHIRGGPAKIRGVMESAKEAQKARDAAKQDVLKADKRNSSAQKLDTRSKMKSGPETVKKERTPTSPNAVRSPATVKPRSPTASTKLPAAATASTAASAAKNDAPQRSPTDANSRKAVTTKPSATSVRPPRASTASTTSTLAKRTSRTSLTNGHDRPQSRISTTKADDSFLARMMRPTASSAQKAHEKVQINSPPRTKVASSHKPKDVVKHKPPPKMRLQPSKETLGTQDENVVSEVAAVSPHTTAKEDPTHTKAEQEQAVSAPTDTSEQPNGKAAPTETIEQPNEAAAAAV